MSKSLRELVDDVVATRKAEQEAARIAAEERRKNREHEEQRIYQDNVRSLKELIHRYFHKEEADALLSEGEFKPVTKTQPVLVFSIEGIAGAFQLRANISNELKNDERLWHLIIPNGLYTTTPINNNPSQWLIDQIATYQLKHGSAN